MAMASDLISDLVRAYFSPKAHDWAWVQISLRTFEERKRAHDRWISLNPPMGAKR